MSNNPLSVVIVNYRSDKTLANCLASVSAFAPKDAEVIIVNNDAIALDHLRREKEALRIVDHRKNVGFGAGANLGAKGAKGEVLLFLNPDSEISSNNIKDVLDEFRKNEKTAIIGSKIISEDGAVHDWIAGKETSFWDIILNNMHFSRSRKIWESQKIVPAEWVSGTALFVRRTFFEEIGGFDEEFFMYFEDMDLCVRSRRAGGDVFYHPHFCVKHLGGKSYRNKKEQKSDYYVSQDFYFKKHRPAWEGWLVRIIRRFFS